MAIIIPIVIFLFLNLITTISITTTFRHHKQNYCHSSSSSSLHRLIAPTLQWSVIQMTRSILPQHHPKFIHNHLDYYEENAWNSWSAISITNDNCPASYNNSTSPTSTNTTLPIPTIDLSNHTQLTHLLQNLSTLNLKTQPLLLRNLWNISTLTSPHRHLSLHGLTTHHHLSQLTIPYFTDASILTTNYDGRLTPNGKSPIGDVVKNVTLGGKEKCGTQIVVERFPELIREVVPPGGDVVGDFLRAVFGEVFDPGCVLPWGPGGILPGMTTVPLFLAGGGGDNSGNDDDISSSHTSQRHNLPRTDLHCEPISNLSVQLHGRKRWTLISPSHSLHLRPTLSRHGRAFIYSSHNPSHLPLNQIPHYTIVTEPGDALYVPTWMWHRVDYVKGSVSLAASVFHFKVGGFWGGNALFAGVVVPNLVKELLGMKTE